MIYLILSLCLFTFFVWGTPVPININRENVGNVSFNLNLGDDSSVKVRIIFKMLTFTSLDSPITLFTT